MFKTVLSYNIRNSLSYKRLVHNVRSISLNPIDVYVFNQISDLYNIIVSHIGLETLGHIQIFIIGDYPLYIYGLYNSYDTITFLYIDPSYCDSFCFVNRYYSTIKCLSYFCKCNDAIFTFYEWTIIPNDKQVFNTILLINLKLNNGSVIKIRFILAWEKSIYFSQNDWFYTITHRMMKSKRCLCIFTPDLKAVYFLKLKLTKRNKVRYYGNPLSLLTICLNFLYYKGRLKL